MCPDLGGYVMLAMLCLAFLALFGWFVRYVRQFEADQARRRLASFDALCYRLQLEREERQRQLEAEFPEFFERKEKAPE